MHTCLNTYKLLHTSTIIIHYNKTIDRKYTTYKYMYIQDTRDVSVNAQQSLLTLKFAFWWGTRFTFCVSLTIDVSTKN